MSTNETHNWGDEARVITHPEIEAQPHYHADLASCVRRAMELADGPSKPASIEIEHAGRFLDLAEIRLLAASPLFPDHDTGPVRVDARLPS